jgi:hypothetical protein
MVLVGCRRSSATCGARVVAGVCQHARNASMASFFFAVSPHRSRLYELEFKLFCLCPAISYYSILSLPFRAPIPTCCVEPWLLIT